MVIVAIFLIKEFVVGFSPFVLSLADSGNVGGSGKIDKQNYERTPRIAARRAGRSKTEENDSYSFSARRNVTIDRVHSLPPRLNVPNIKENCQR